MKAWKAALAAAIASRWRVAVSDNLPDPTADAQVVCAKGTGGFKVKDLGEADG